MQVSLTPELGNLRFEWILCARMHARTHTHRYFQLLSEPNHPEDIQIPRPLGWALLPFCKWLRSPVSKMKVRTIERKAAVNLIHLFNPTHHPSHPAHRPWLLLVKYLLIREAIGSRQLCSRAPRHQHPANIFPGTKDVSFAPTLSTHNGAETTLGFPELFFCIFRCMCQKHAVETACCL